MSQPKQYRASLAAPVTFEQSAADGEAPAGPKSFRASPAYSGAPVPGHTLTPPMQGSYIIDLAGTKSGKSPKANLDHKSTQRVGHVTEFENDGKSLTMGGKLSAKTPYRDEVSDSAGDGYEWNVSIEGTLNKPVFLKAGETDIVNGRHIEGPITIFRQSTITELAFVSRGADEGNAVNIAASAAGAATMTEFEKYIVSCGHEDPSAISDSVRATLQASFNLVKAGPVSTTKLGSFAELADREEKENARRTTILSIGDRYMKRNPDQIAHIRLSGEQAIENNLTPDAFELSLVRDVRLQSGNVRNSASEFEHSDPRIEQKVRECALSLITGVKDAGVPGRHYSQQVLNLVDDRGWDRGSFSLSAMLIQEASKNGMTIRMGEKIHPGNIREILEYAMPPRSLRAHDARLAFSTASLPGVLGEVANKHIRDGYNEGDNTWMEIADVKPVSNFYTQNHYRILDSLEYEEVGSGGEIKHGTLGQETFTTQAKTYGKMLGLTRNQIINDDLSAFDDIKARLGRGANKKFNNVFWAAFIDNSSFFTSALTNYISGSTTNLGIDGVGLGLMVAAFRAMTTPSADGLKRVGADINPSKILVPPELEANAEMIHKNTNMGAVPMATTANIYQSRYRPVVQWRLSNSSYTGYSTTAYYLFGDEVKPMTVTLLNGKAEPTIDSTEADFNALGILFRGYHDFGADKSEYLAGVKSKGAA